ncbi:MAG: hypothetical protein L6R41_005108 [Letrouitia leprolyta]|nr:MAG: hypothetical protein L6R41_005108 [Letrouitia leprolyta]
MLRHRFVNTRNQEIVEEDCISTLNQKRFSLRDEARNTERHSGWNSDQKLRHSQINFVGNGSSTLDKLTGLQGTSQVTPYQSNAPRSPSKVTSASMTIEDQDLYCADSQILDRILGRSASVFASATGSPDRVRDQGDPIDGVFLADAVGPNTRLNNALTPPKTRNFLSPSHSDTSEEVIVFAGRINASQNSLQYRQQSNHRPFHSRKNPIVAAEPQQNNSGATQSPTTISATPHESYELAESTDQLPEPVFLDTPANENPRDHLRLTRKERHYLRRSTRKARRQAEEDIILANYIEHMQSEEDVSETFRDLAQDEVPRRGLSINHASEVNFDGDAKEIALAQLFAENRVQDLHITKDCHGSDLVPSTVSNSDSSINDPQITANCQEHMDDIEDERDLFERRQAMMTDEQIARLLAKQEQFGLSSSELLLFDGNETRDEGHFPSEDEEDAVLLGFSAASKLSRRGQCLQQYQAPGASKATHLAADFLNQDPFGGFDVMDHARPSLKRTSRGRRGAPAIELSDAELDAHLSLAWEKDRLKKKIRKKEREELRAQGLLSGTGQTDLKAKYREGISFSQIQTELKEFIVSTRQRYLTFQLPVIPEADFCSLALPPMANKERRVVHEIAHALRLKSKSSGVGKARFPVLFKTRRTDELDPAIVSNLEAVFNSQRFFPRRDVKGKKKLDSTRPGRRNAGKIAGVSYQDGEVVGAAAPEIGVENRGRAMLEKMGWSKGTALGALNNKGMLQPVIHTVKTTKAGLG